MGCLKPRQDEPLLAVEAYTEDAICTGETVSGGPVVANDPVNATDPTGEEANRLGVNITFGNSIGGGFEAGFYWGTKKDGSRDYGIYSQKNIGAAIGAQLSVVSTRDIPFAPEVFTDELAGTGLDMGSAGYVKMVGPVPVEAGATGNVIATEDGPKNQLTGHVGIGVVGEITGSFTDTVSIPDTLDSIANGIGEALPNFSIPPLVPEVTPTISVNKEIEER